MAINGGSKQGRGKMKKGMVTYGIILAVLLVFTIVLFKENQLLRGQNLVLSNNFNNLADRILSLEQILDTSTPYASDPGDGIVYVPEAEKFGTRKQKISYPDYFQGGNQGYITRDGALTN